MELLRGQEKLANFCLPSAPTKIALDTPELPVTSQCGRGTIVNELDYFSQSPHSGKDAVCHFTLQNTSHKGAGMTSLQLHFQNHQQDIGQHHVS